MKIGCHIKQRYYIESKIVQDRSLSEPKLLLPCGDPEYARHVLLVGVNDVRFSDTRDLELGVSHVQNLTNGDICK